MQEMEEVCYSSSASKAVYLGLLAAAARSALNTATNPHPRSQDAADLDPGEGPVSVTAGGTGCSDIIGQGLPTFSAESTPGDPRGGATAGEVAAGCLEEKVARLEVQGLPLRETLQGLTDLKDIR
jgi:hypothetical protein